MSQPRFAPYQQGEEAGIIAMSIFSLLSSLALVSVVIRISWLAVRHRLSVNQRKPEFVFFNTQLGRYAACLLAANSFIGAAGLIGIRWVIQKGIAEGVVCTVQAILNQIGNWATAYFTVIIAVHTFNSLVLRKRQSTLTCAITISAGWILAGLLAGAPLFRPQTYKSGPPYGGDGFSCGVRSVYLKAQFFLHLFPILLASVLLVVLYSIIFLVLRGTLSIKGGITLTLDPNERWVVGKVTDNYHRFVARIARSMLWYPIGYIILLAPYSVTRLFQISGFFVPFGLLVFAYTCWFMLGVVNVLLLCNTFRVLGPAFNDYSRSTTRGDGESFGTPEHLWSKAQWGSYKERSDSYSRPAPTYQSLSGQSVEEISPRSSVHALLPIHLEKTASTQSLYNDPASLPIGRAINPVADINQTFASSESANDYASQRSTDSLGLPPPPRQTRSPILRLPSIDSKGSPVRTVNGTWSPVHLYLSKQTLNHTPGRPLPVESSSLNQCSKKYPHGSTTSGLYAGPMLSAVGSAFPISERSPISLPHHVRLPSMVGPAPGGQRRMLLAGNNGSAGKTSVFAHVGMDFRA